MVTTCTYKGDSEHKNGVFCPIYQVPRSFVIPGPSFCRSDQWPRTGRISPGVKERRSGTRRTRKHARTVRGVANETRADTCHSVGEPRTRSRMVGASVMYIVGGAKW